MELTRICELLELMSDLVEQTDPTMVRHCVSKVFRRVGGTGAAGSRRQKLVGKAQNICRNNFTKNRYMSGSKKRRTMTGKGQARNRLHKKEGVAPYKEQDYLKILAGKPISRMPARAYKPGLIRKKRGNKVVYIPRK